MLAEPQLTVSRSSNNSAQPVNSVKSKSGNQDIVNKPCKECDKKPSIPNNITNNLERSKFLSSLRVKRNRFKRADSFDTVKSFSQKSRNSTGEEVNHGLSRLESAPSNRTLGNLRLARQVKATSLGDLTKSSNETSPRSCIFAALESEVVDCGGGHSYLYAPLLPCDGSLIDAVVLSSWDNIVGPKAAFVWTRRGSDDGLSPTGNVIQRFGSCHSVLDIQGAIEYAVGHTLHGELDRNCSSGSINTEMYIVADKGFILAAVTFGASHRDRPREITPHSLAAVIPFLQLARYIEIQSLVNQWMEKLAYTFRVLLHMWDHAEALSRASMHLLEFANVLSSLHMGSLTASKRTDTYLVRDSFADQSFIKKAVTSHLQTCGCSVVIGDSTERVNLMVRTLALFLAPSEKNLVRLVCAGPVQRRSAYATGLLVQGVLGDHLGAANIQMDDVLRSQYPTTVVNVTNEQVLRSRFPPEHAKQQRLAVRADIEKLVQTALCTGRVSHYPEVRRTLASSSNATSKASTHIKSILQAVTDVAPVVRNVFSELRLTAGGCEPNWEEAVVGKFLRQLEYRALTLILYVQSSRRQPFEYQNGKLVKGTALMVSLSRKQLRKCLDLEDEDDFRIVIAFAEKLKPGVYEFVMSAYHP